MRNYIRYIVILVLIIAGGLLIISVINRFTDPGTTKVDNSTKTEEKETPTLDIEPTAPDEEDSSNKSQVEETTPDTNSPTTSDQDTQSTDNATPETIPDTSSQETTENNNVIVPDTGTKESMIYTIIGFTMITGSICLIKKYQTNTK